MCYNEDGERISGPRERGGRETQTSGDADESKRPRMIRMFSEYGLNYLNSALQRQVQWVNQSKSVSKLSHQPIKHMNNVDAYLDLKRALKERSL
jgi:hypothetical protein